MCDSFDPWHGEWKITAEGTGYNNALASIGRKKEWDEIVGCGKDRHSAFEDAILSEV